MGKLFMIGLGGRIKGANVEVHAMQFVIADKLENCYDDLRKRWYGESLHIDSYTELEFIDGYQIDLTSTTNTNLYMVVYGGYQKGKIDELHDYDFVLALSKADAKKEAKKRCSFFPHMDHIDEIVDVFENVGQRFGLQEADVQFKDNMINHTFIKLK